MENFTDSDLVVVPERPERERAMEDSDEDDFMKTSIGTGNRGSRA